MAATKKPTTIPAIRAALAELKREREQLRNAGPSRAEMQAGHTAFVRGSAAAGEQRIAHAVASDELRAALIVYPRADGTFDLMPTLAALFPAEVLAAFGKHLEQVPEGMDAPQRAQRIAELDAEIWELECADEIAVLRAEATGTPIGRRADADPCAVIGTDTTDDAEPRSLGNLVATAEHDAEPRSNSVRSKYMERRE